MFTGLLKKYYEKAIFINKTREIEPSPMQSPAEEGGGKMGIIYEKDRVGRKEGGSKENEDLENFLSLPFKGQKKSSELLLLKHNQSLWVSLSGSLLLSLTPTVQPPPPS